MTLIVSCLTHTFAVQVSDRRVTLIDGSGVEDRANKALFYGWNMAWAYTGLATLDGLRTDDWLTRRLEKGTANLADTWRMVAQRAETAVRSIPFRSGVPTDQRDLVRRLAFVGCGFVGLSQQAQQLSPVLAVISNFHVPPGRWMARADRRFSTWFYTLEPEQPLVVFTAGAELAPRARRQLVRTRRVAISKGVGPHTVARLLVRAVKEHSRVVPTVGSTVLCAITTPQRQPSGGTLHFGGTPVPLYSTEEADWFKSHGFDGGPTFLYAPGSWTDRVAFGPVHVFPGEMTVGGLVFGPAEEVHQYRDLGPFPPYRFVATDPSRQAG